MDYSPFKDYFNLSSLIKSNTKDYTEEPIDIHDESERSDDSRYIDLLWGDPPTPDSLSDTDFEGFEFKLCTSEDKDGNVFSDENVISENRQYTRTDSLSSSQYSSSGEESFSEEMSCDVFSNDQQYLSAILGQFNFTEKVIQTPIQYQFIPAKASDEKYCILCKRNGETREYYTTHVLKDNRGKVICPVLRKYVCPKCNATGDRAHTLRHCPLSDTQGSSTTETCYTLRSSCGRRRKKIM